MVAAAAAAGMESQLQRKRTTDLQGPFPEVNKHWRSTLPRLPRLMVVVAVGVVVVRATSMLTGIAAVAAVVASEVARNRMEAGFCETQQRVQRLQNGVSRQSQL
jgi:hypothetical protein